MELSDLGAMALEQNRIRQEIVAQTVKLQGLEASPVPQLDKAKFILHKRQTALTLQFGANRLGSQLIWAAPAPGLLAPRTLVMETRELDQ